jgi:hypothetical protein
MLQQVILLLIVVQNAFTLAEKRVLSPSGSQSATGVN